MGAGLAAQAGMQYGISDSARLVLIRMALTAKDTDPEPVYYGGWAFLATAGLGRWTYNNAAKEKVKRAIRELVTAGLVESKPPDRPGGHARYYLHMRLSTGL